MWATDAAPAEMERRRRRRRKKKAEHTACGRPPTPPQWSSSRRRRRKRRKQSIQHVVGHRCRPRALTGDGDTPRVPTESRNVSLQNRTTNTSATTDG